MRFYGYIACFMLAVSTFIGCSSGGGSEPLAGIEIGNPALALTADFSVDYSEVETNSLKKSAAKDEPMLLDSFSMELSEVRSYSSYYVAVTIDPTEGLPLWPYEDNPDEVLPISFTEESSVNEPFKKINLEDYESLTLFRVSKDNLLTTTRDQFLYSEETGFIYLATYFDDSGDAIYYTMNKENNDPLKDLYKSIYQIEE